MKPWDKIPTARSSPPNSISVVVSSESRIETFLGGSIIQADYVVSENQF